MRTAAGRARRASNRPRSARCNAPAADSPGEEVEAWGGFGARAARAERYSATETRTTSAPRPCSSHTAGGLINVALKIGGAGSCRGGDEEAVQAVKEPCRDRTSQPAVERAASAGPTQARVVAVTVRFGAGVAGAAAAEADRWRGAAGPLAELAVASAMLLGGVSFGEALEGGSPVVAVCGAGKSFSHLAAAPGDRRTIASLRSGLRTVAQCRPCHFSGQEQTWYYNTASWNCTVVCLLGPTDSAQGRCYPDARRLSLHARVGREDARRVPYLQRTGGPALCQSERHKGENSERRSPSEREAQERARGESTLFPLAVACIRGGSESGGW